MFAKNKLYKHHKSKAVLVMRNFSLNITAAFAIIALAAIPTYINSKPTDEIKATESTEIAQSDVTLDSNNGDVVLTIED